MTFRYESSKENIAFQQHGSLSLHPFLPPSILFFPSTVFFFFPFFFLVIAYAPLCSSHKKEESELRREFLSSLPAVLAKL